MGRASRQVEGVAMPVQHRYPRREQRRQLGPLRARALREHRHRRPFAQDVLEHAQGTAVGGAAFHRDGAAVPEEPPADRVREQTSQLREHGLDIDMPSLVYTGERSHVIDYLRDKAWDVAGTPRADLFVSNGRQVPSADNDDPLGEIIYVSGTLRS